MVVRGKAFFGIIVILLLLPFASYASSALAPTVDPGVLSAAPSSQQGNTPPPSKSSLVRIPFPLPSVISEASSLGPVNPATPVSFGVLLPSRNSAGLEQYINRVSNASSKQYHQFLSTGEYEKLYGPDGSEANLLTSYFASNGLAATLDKSNPDLMIIGGAASDAEKALQVSIQSFKLGGTVFYSATSGPKLPSEFSNIRAVFGLTNYGSEINVSGIPMVKVLGQVSANPAQTTTANTVYYSPSEIRQIYNSTALVNEGYTGSGIAIAIVDAFGDPYVQQELDNFSSEFNLPQATINQICVDGPCNYAEGIAQGWNSEIALDVQWAHAMAPNAMINLYVARNNSFPLYDAVQKAVSDGVNSIISLSWGSPENSIAASAAVAPVFGENYPWLDQVFQQAAAQGMTVFASTGDWGAYDQTQGEVSPYGGAIYPSTDPYVTAVGGTSLYMNASAGYTQSPYFNATGVYGKETAWSWNNFYGWATGGGYSTIFGAPNWQRGVSGGGARAVPDVAWDADPQTGVIESVYDPATSSFTYFVVGGTSVGAPSWAGSFALIEQKAGGRLGLINPMIYSIFNNSSEYSRGFHDVTSGNNNPDSAAVGWDPLTGVGSPNLGELANYIAPTGSLAVSVKNTQSSGQLLSLDRSYAYGSSIGLTAAVTNSSGTVASGTVTASIVGPRGQQVAQGIPLAFNSASNAWSGSYAIKPSDPAGIWTSEISATSGSSEGVGFTTFSVGDGITLFGPYYNSTTGTASLAFLSVGQIINVSAEVTSPAGSCCVSSGNFIASFFLDTPGGKSEGTTTLSYNSTSGLWQGRFNIPHSADQGAWVLEVSGTDSSGNAGFTYSWINVGLNVLVLTDSPDYVIGDTMTILSAPLYTDNTIATTGNFTATLSLGSKLLAAVQLTFNWVQGAWVGSLMLDKSYPTGYYTIAVSGDDGDGNAGIFATIVQVAPFNLQARLTLQSQEISVSGGREPTISARITYPSGTVMTSGSVEAFVSLDLAGTFVPVGHTRLTYQASTLSFVGLDLLASTNPLKTHLGDYLVSVQAFDSDGNYGNFTTSFFVKGIARGGITISNNEQFTQNNGVLGGTGTPSSPYIIAGWNTSSISITSNVTASYELLNNWVEGSSSDGILLNTPNSVGSSIKNVYSMSNHGNGLVVTDVRGINISSVVSRGNTLNGIVVVSSSSSSNALEGSGGGLFNSVAFGNGANGFEVKNTPYFSISSNSATNNGKYGFYIYDSTNASLTANNATGDDVGIYVSGAIGQTYGGVSIVSGDIMGNNVGIQIDGLGQTIADTATSPSSAVLVYGTNQLENNVGLLAANDSEITIEANTIGYNNYGVIVENSLPLIVNNVISENTATGLNVTGAFLGNGHCQVIFTNSTEFLFSSCVAVNYLTLNGKIGSPSADGLAMSNLNGSFVYQNEAIGNAGNGLDLSGLEQSVVSSIVSVENAASGILVRGGANNGISGNLLGGNDNGLVVSKSADNYVDSNNATLNAIDGILVNDGGNNTLVNNVALENAGGCGSLCAAAGGIELSDTSQNLVSSNTLSNNTSPAEIGAGVFLSSGSTGNLVFLN
ncbi:MAG: protease pro-enzyme activation domain-containing protein, partial [Nitrososphaerales archaeon]